MKTITTSDVENAIRHYDKGERPYLFTKPRAWYLVSKRSPDVIREQPLGHLRGGRPEKPC